MSNKPISQWDPISSRDNGDYIPIWSPALGKEVRISVADFIAGLTGGAAEARP